MSDLADRHLSDRLRQAAAHARSALAGMEVDVALNVHHLIRLAEHAAGELAPDAPGSGLAVVEARTAPGFEVPGELVVAVDGRLAHYRLERVRDG